MSTPEQAADIPRLKRLRSLAGSLAESNPSHFSQLQKEYASATPTGKSAYIRFMGTGQGTHNIAARGPLKSKGRYVSGPQISSGTTSIWIDPGPDSLELINLSGIDARHIDALLISHAHTDHYGNIACTVEAIAGGTEIKGVKSLYGNRTSLLGSPVSPPLLSEYHTARILREARVLSPGSSVEVGDMTVTALPCSHRENPVADDSLNWGIDLPFGGRSLRIVHFDGNVFKVDGGNPTDEVLEDTAHYAVDCNILIVNVSNHVKTWSSSQNYVSTKGLIHLALNTRANVIFTTHFGIEMLRPSDEELKLLGAEGFSDIVSFQAAFVEEEARAVGKSLRVIAATDLMLAELLEDGLLVKYPGGDEELISWL